MNTTQPSPLLASSAGELFFEPRVISTTLPRRDKLRKHALRGSLSLLVDVFELRAWTRMSLVEGFLLAAYAAAMAQPIVYGTMGRSVVALMTPVK